MLDLTGYQKEQGVSAPAITRFFYIVATLSFSENKVCARLFTFTLSSITYFIKYCKKFFILFGAYRKSHARFGRFLHVKKGYSVFHKGI